MRAERDAGDICMSPVDRSSRTLCFAPPGGTRITKQQLTGHALLGACCLSDTGEPAGCPAAGSQAARRGNWVS